MSQRPYIQELRQNRADRLACMEARHSEAPVDMSRVYLGRMTRIQNQTRGKLGELMGEVALTSRNVATADIARDNATFDTPDGRRRVDVWHRETKTAIEVKSGHACLNKQVRAQIEKDAFLLRTGVFARVEWLLLQGGSNPLLKRLATHGIAVHIGWPKVAMGDEVLTAGDECLSLSSGEIR